MSRSTSVDDLELASGNPPIARSAHSLRPAAATFLALAMLAGGGLAQTTTRVSVSSSGVEANGPTTSAAIAESARWVAMQSSATNLVVGDSNGVDDVFLHDCSTGTTTRSSVASSGAQANGDSALPSISGNGELIAFESKATNLAPGYGPASQIYVHDRAGGPTTMAASSVAGNGASTACAISLDGQWVVFESLASNLVPADSNGVSDVFVASVGTGTTTRVSVSSLNAQGNGASRRASISADGRYVTFISSATNLVAGDTNLVDDAFLHDTLTGVTTRISLTSAGLEADDTTEGAAISPDGGYVALASDASNLVSSDTNMLRDVFVKNLTTGEVVLVSVSFISGQGNGNSFFPDISWYGRDVSFHSLATNLDPSVLDLNGTRDVFKVDFDTSSMTSGPPSLISANGSAAAGGTSWLASLGAAGGQLAYPSLASNLVAVDGNGTWDVFVYAPGPTVYCTAGVSQSGCQAAISASGTASLSLPGGFTLTVASGEGNSWGLFLFGINGRQANPWGNGTSYQCVVPPVRRTKALPKTGTNGSCNGLWSMDFNAFFQAKPNKAPPACVPVQMQLWYRDSGNTSNQTTSFSDAIECTFAL